jgi:hypothetical protein
MKLSVSLFSVQAIQIHIHQPPLAFWGIIHFIHISAMAGIDVDV